MVSVVHSVLLIFAYCYCENETICELLLSVSGGYFIQPAPHQFSLLGRDRFESTASAGRRIPSASPIDLPIPEDPLSTVFREPTFQNGSQNKHSSKERNTKKVD